MSKIPLSVPSISGNELNYIKECIDSEWVSSAGKYVDLFEEKMHKSQMIGIFLAVLELIRHHNLECEQQDLFGEMWLLSSETLGDDLDLTAVDSYDHKKPDAATDS